MSAPVHPKEERLVLHLLHLCAEEAAAIDAHLAGCDACRAECSELRETLALVDSLPMPHRGEGYGADVWRRIRPRIAGIERPAWRSPAVWGYLFPPRSWAMAGTLAALLLAAFLAGRHWPVPSEPIPGQARERILLVAVGDHLERAQMMLVELVNSDDNKPPGSTVDISGARQRAEDLVAANRIYRQATAGTGDAAMASVLDELERVLLDIAHRPSQLTPEELERIRGSIESEGILFKVKIIGSRVREREKAASPAPKGPARGST